MSDAIPKKPHEDPTCACDGCKAVLPFAPSTAEEWRKFCEANELPMPDHAFCCEASNPGMAARIGETSLDAKPSPCYQQGWRAREAAETADESDGDA